MIISGIGPDPENKASYGTAVATVVAAFATGEPQENVLEMTIQYAKRIKLEQAAIDYIDADMVADIGK